MGVEGKVEKEGTQTAFSMHVGTGVCSMSIKSSSRLTMLGVQYFFLQPNFQTIMFFFPLSLA